MREKRPRVTVLVEGFLAVGEGGAFAATSTAVLVEISGKKIIIDPGSWSERKHLLEALSKRSIKPEDIDMVLTTHTHADHTQNAMLFRPPRLFGRSGIQHYLNRTTKEYAQGELAKLTTRLDYCRTDRRERARILTRANYLRGVIASVSREGAPLSDMLGIRLIQTPGHNKDHLSFLVRDADLVFSVRGREKKVRGDVVIAGDAIVSKIYRDRNEVYCYNDDFMDETTAKHSQAELLKLGDWILPGHGLPFSPRDSVDDIETLLFKAWATFLASANIERRRTYAGYLETWREAGDLPMPQLKAGDSVLDLGCGKGEAMLDIAKIIGPKGRLVGVDIDTDNISWAKDNLAKKLDPMKYTVMSTSVDTDPAKSVPLDRQMANAERTSHRRAVAVYNTDASDLIKCKDNYFDVVLSIWVFYYIPHKIEAAIELLRTLKVGGKAYILSDNPLYILDRELYPLDVDHIISEILFHGKKHGVALKERGINYQRCYLSEFLQTHLSNIKVTASKTHMAMIIEKTGPFKKEEIEALPRYSFFLFLKPRGKTFAFYCTKTRKP